MPSFLSTGLRDFATRAREPNYLGVPMGVRDYAQKTQAALSRREFDEFMQLYYPLLRQQVSQVDSPDALNMQRNEARSRVAGTLGLASATRDQQLRSFGITPSAEQSGVMGKQDALTAGLSDIDAYNRTTQQVRDRDFALTAGLRSPTPGGR